MDNNAEVLRLLEQKHNVLLSGAPGTGKSKIMNEVAKLFETGGGSIANPSLVTGAPVPIPATAMPSGISYSFFNKKNRKVFRTTLHQNSKYHDFLTGIIPQFGSAGFDISQGILYRANEFAMQNDSAALLIIDELNRGPAIEVFGGSIVAIENDKRLDDAGNPTSSTQFFEILDPVTKSMKEYAFSNNLYILAAMNQADASVAPLDVAFLRRWQTYDVEPDMGALYSEYKVNPSDSVPSVASNSNDVFNVTIHALEKINKLISVGRGPEYQLGQGALLSSSPAGNSLDDALEFVLEAWSLIYTHIQELFFGDSMSIASIVNAESNESPYSVEEVEFAGELKIILTHKKIDKSNIFALYHAITTIGI